MKKKQLVALCLGSAILIPGQTFPLIGMLTADKKPKMGEHEAKLQKVKKASLSDSDMQQDMSEIEAMYDEMEQHLKMTMSNVKKLKSHHLKAVKHDEVSENVLDKMGKMVDGKTKKDMRNYHSDASKCHSECEKNANRLHEHVKAGHEKSEKALKDAKKTSKKVMDSKDAVESKVKQMDHDAAHHSSMKKDMHHSMDHHDMNDHKDEPSKTIVGHAHNVANKSVDAAQNVANKITSPLAHRG